MIGRNNIEKTIGQLGHLWSFTSFSPGRKTKDKIKQNNDQESEGETYLSHLVLYKDLD